MCFRWPILLLVGLSTASPCAAENHALLIGIDEYQQRDQINSLSGAAADAMGIAKALQEAAGFAPENMRVLTSDGQAKPSADNIRGELGQLTKRVKPGDVVFVLYSGHGIEMDGTTYLLPWETDARNDATLKRTAFSTSDLVQPLKQLPAKAVILAYDMCRTDPRGGGKDIGPANSLRPAQVKDLVLVARQSGTTGPQAAITLFSCSPRERSWEWREKRRGYFSYFLEAGLRRDAADGQGVVRVKNLVDYLQKAVYGAVQRDEGKEQTPYPIMEGPGASDLVLASGRPPGAGGATAVPSIIANTGSARYEALVQLGFEYFRMKDYPGAEKQFQEALLIDVKSATAWYMLGAVSGHQRDWERAEPRLKKALELNPRNARASEALGIINSRRGDIDEAERLYRSAMQLDPAAALPVNNLGELYYRDRMNPREAERFFRRALELDPTFATASNNLAALVYFEKKDYREAERLFRRAIQIDPNDSIATWNLGRLYYDQKKDYAEAERLYRKAMQLNPNWASPVNSLASLCFDRRDYAEAERQYRKAIELNASSGLYHASLGLCLLQLNRRQEAEAAARKAIELGYKGPHPVFSRLNITP